MTLVSTAYQRYLASPEWRAKRRQRLGIDSFKCARCESDEQLEVHHLTYDRLGSERMDDLLTLCRICHKKDHGRDPDLPPCMPASFYSDLWFAGQRLEIWQEALAEALGVHKALDDLESCIGERERLGQVRDLLSEIMRDYAHRFGQQWEEEAA